METDRNTDGDQRRLRLLVAEDDVLLGALLVEALDADYELSRARTAARAKVLLAAGGLDGLLLDWRLAEETAATVLHDADWLGVPTLLISGDPGTVADLARRGRTALAKPFGLVELRDALQGLLATSAPTRHAARPPTGNAT